MKKKNILIACASILSVGIVATSIAAYIQTPEDKEVSIGGSAISNGNLTLTLVNNKDNSSTNPTIFEKIAEAPATVNADNLNTTINPYNKLHARYQLGVNALQEYKEPVIYGQINLEIDTTFDYNDLEINAIVDGYATNLGDMNNGHSYMLKNNRNVLTEKAEGSNGTKKVFHIDAPFSINSESHGVQYLDLQIGLKADAANNYVLKGAEKTLSYTATLSYPPSSAVVLPYLVGTHTGWQEDEAYRLYPNINSQVEEYMLLGATFTSTSENPTEVKVKHGNEWSETNRFASTNAEYFEIVGDNNLGIKKDCNVDIYYKPVGTDGEGLGKRDTWFEISK